MSDTEASEKTCRRCGVSKPMEEGFCRNRNERDGRASWCRECAAEWRRANPGKAKTYAERYYEKPEAQEKRREYQRKRNRRPEIRERRMAEAKKRRERLRKKHPNLLRLLEVKRAPCTDCGQTYPPEIMELDHVRGERGFSLNQVNAMKISISEAEFETELAKCELRCPTCHRLRHHREKTLGRPMLV